MQWQTVKAAKAKDRVEKTPACCLTTFGSVDAPHSTNPREGAGKMQPSVPLSRPARIWGVQHPVRLFVAVLLKRWWELVACAAFTILGVYSTAANKGNVWLVGGSAFLAAVFFGVVAYHAWREEHDKYTGEVAKYQTPDISGEAFNFSGNRNHGDDRSPWSTSHEVTFEVFFRNHSPINTTLKRIELDGTRLTPAVLFHFHVIGAALGEAAFPVGLEMPRGIGKQITVRVTAMVGGLGIRQIPPIALDNLAVHIVDAFEQKHPIRIRPGERLIIGED
jgi:hypothetical protein